MYPNGFIANALFSVCSSEWAVIKTKGMWYRSLIISASAMPLMSLFKLMSSAKRSGVEVLSRCSALSGVGVVKSTSYPCFTSKDLRWKTMRGSSSTIPIRKFAAITRGLRANIILGLLGCVLSLNITGKTNETSLRYRELYVALPDYGDSVSGEILRPAADLSLLERAVLKGHLQILKGEILSMGSYCDSLVNEATSANNTAMLAEAFQLRSLYLKLVQRYAESVRDIDSAITLLGENPLPEVDIAFHISMMEVYRAARRFKAGLAFFYDMLPRVEQMQVSPILKSQFYHRGAALSVESFGDPDEQHRLLDIALRYALASDHYAGLATIWNEQGFLFHVTGKYLKAIALYERSVKAWRKTGQLPNLGNTLLNLSRSYLELGRYDEVNKRLREVGEINKNLQLDFLVVEYYATWSTYYARLGRWKEAYHYSDTAIEEKMRELEAFFNQELLRVSTQLELSEKQALLRQQQLDLLRMKSEVTAGRRETQTLWAVLLVFIFFLIILALLYQRLLKRRVQLHLQQDELIIKNKQLEESVEVKNLLLREVHHRVKNNLAVLGGIIYMKSAQANDVEAGKAYADVLSSIRTIADLHNNLVSGQPGARVDLSIYLPKILKSITGSLTDSELEISFRTEIDPLEVDLDRALNLALLINEIVSNACKYAFAGRSEGEIICMLKAKEKNFESLIIGDNGIGLEEKVKNKTERSFGLEFIQVLSEHMLLKVQINNDIGTVYHFTPA